MSTYIKLFEDFVQDKECRLKVSATSPDDEEGGVEEDYTVADEQVPNQAGMQLMLQSQHQQRVEAAASPTASTTTATETAPESIATTNAKPITTTVQTTFISPQQRQQSLAASAVGAAGTTNAPTTSVTRKPYLLAKPPKIIVRRPATAPANCPTPALADCKKMEHSYMRDSVRNYSEITGLAPTRTVLVRRPPPCSSCNPPVQEEPESEDKYAAAVPTYNEIAAKECMNECKRLAACVKNNNADDEDWESNVKTANWSNPQKVLFEQIVRILDADQLARLANVGRPNEAMQRRCFIDKAASRFRKALVSVQWDRRITQWLHDLLMDHLPPSYMASYMDILQTLKSKLPELVDQMLFSRPLHVSQELLAPVLKGKWEPQFNAKSQKLIHDAVIVMMPPLPYAGNNFKRYDNWVKEFSCFAPVHQITYPVSINVLKNQDLETVAEAIVSLARVKIQDLRHENPKRSIILVGFNASAALALQAAMSENLACVVCLGFAYNTIHGERGAPDDRILDIKVPILFVIGQNSARTSQEEMESLREKMLADTGLVVVGSADDYLRMSRDRRKLENVTQAMVDSMVLDEVHDYIEKTLANPPGVRIPTTTTASSAVKSKVLTPSNATVSEVTHIKSTPVMRKRRADGTYEIEPVLAKMKSTPSFNRARPRPVPANLSPNKPHIISATTLGIGKPKLASSISNEDLNLAIQSILGDSDPENSTFNASSDSPPKIVTNYELVAASKTSPVKTTLFPLQKAGALNNPALVRTIPSNQIVQLKPATQAPAKVYKAQSGLGTLMSSTQSSPQHMFTLKSPDGQTTQYVTAAPSAVQQKFTVVRNAAGGTSLQLAPAATVAETTRVAGGDTNVDLASIIDMPIVFADNEGNITESVSVKPQSIAVKPKTSNSGVGKLIINQEIIKHADVPAANRPVTPASQTSQQQGSALQRQQNPGKFVFINRHTMKPCTVTNIGNTKVVTKLPFTGVVNTSKPIAITQLARSPNVSGVATSVSTQQITASAIKKLNLQTINTAGALTLGSFTQKGTQNLQFVNATAGGAQRTIATVQGRSVYVKPFVGQISNQVKQQLMNRNLIVRQVGNQPTVTAISSAEASHSNADTEGTVAMSSPNMQSLPKIITLNPINPSNVSPPKSE